MIDNRDEILDELYEKYKEQALFKIKPRELPGVEDERKAIAEAMKNPIESPSIEELARGKKNALIIADDITRATPKDKIVPMLLDELNRVGIPDENITVLIALGTHRYMSDEEIERCFGKEVVERVQVLNHEWEKEETFVYLGETENGTPVYVNKLITTADLTIGLGNIIPHLFAGYGGGAKIVQPGITNEETTAATHLLVFKKDDPLQLVGNPDNWVRLEMERVAEKAGLKFIVNVVINTKKELVHVVAGDTVRAHRAGVKVAEKVYRIPVPEKADVTVVSSEPADIDYWQSIKGFTHAAKGTKEGGTIIMLTPSPEGISPVHKILEEYGTLSYEEVKRKVEKKEFDDLVGAASLLLHAYLRERFNLIVVSEGITEKMCEALAMTHAKNIDEAMEIALEGREKAKIGLIHYGGEVFPDLQSP